MVQYLSSRPLIWLILPSILVTSLLWLPFGFNMGGLIEEWDFLSLYTQHGVFFIAEGGSPLASHRMRPLFMTPAALAYFLGPDSFFFWHVLLILSLIFKGYAVSTLAWFVTHSRRTAVFCGILVILYPADTMQLALRSMPIGVSLSLCLLAAVCQIYAYVSLAQYKKIILAGLGILFLVIASLMYEVAIFLAPVPFIILFARFGFRPACRLVWKQHWITAGWVAAVVACAGYMIYVSLDNQFSYQGVVAGGVLTALKNMFMRVHILVGVLMVRAFIGGWFDALGILFYEFQSYGYLAASFFLITGMFYCSKLMNAHKEEQVSNGLIVRFAFAGFLLVILGLLPYLAVMGLVGATQRTYLFASMGAVFFWAASLMKLEFHSYRYAAVIVGGLMLLLGMAAQLFQYNHYDQLWNKQKNILGTIIKYAPNIESSQRLVIFDASARINDTWMLKDRLTHALTYFYHHPMKEVEIYLSQPKQILKDDVFLRIEQDGSVKNMQGAIVSKNMIRYQNILVEKKLLFLDFALFKKMQAGSYSWNFGRWRNMDVPPQGVGWGEIEWTRKYFYLISSAWKIEPRSTLLFQLVPEARNYILEGKVIAFKSLAIKEALQIQINGHKINYVWKTEETFTAQINQAWLKNGLNEIIFISPVEHKQSIALAGFRIYPKSDS